MTTATSRDPPPSFALLHLSNDQCSSDLIETRYREYSQIRNPDPTYPQLLETARRTLHDKVRREKEWRTLFPPSLGPGVIAFFQVSATPEDLYKKKIITQSVSLQSLKFPEDPLTDLEVTISLTKGCFHKSIVPNITWKTKGGRSTASEFYLVYRLNENPYETPEIRAWREYAKDVSPHALFVEFTLRFNFFRNLEWYNSKRCKLQSSSPVSLSELYANESDERKAEIREIYNKVVEATRPRLNTGAQPMEVGSLTEAFEQRPPESPSHLWEVIRPLFPAGLLREPTRLWEQEILESDEKLKAKAIEIWNQLKPHISTTEKVSQAVFFDIIAPHLPPLWKTLFRPSLPRVPFLLHHPYHARNGAWDSTDAYYQFTVEEEIEFSNNRIVKIRMAGPSDISNVKKLLLGNNQSKSLKAIALQDITAFLSSPPIVSLLAIHNQEVIAVLLGSLRFHQRLPSKRDLGPEIPKQLTALCLKYESDPPIIICNGFIALVHVVPEWRHNHLGRRLVQEFIEFTGNVYGVMSFTTEIPEHEVNLLKFYTAQHFRTLDCQPNRFTNGEAGRWLERDILLEDTIPENSVGQLQWSPFVLLEVDFDAHPNTIEQNFQKFQALKHPDPHYYEQLKLAKEILLNEERKIQAIYELFKDHGDNGCIFFETIEISTLDLYTRQYHEYTLEIPPSYGYSHDKMYQFKIRCLLNPELLDGFLIPEVRWENITPPQFGLPPDPGYYFSVRLKERPTIRELRGKKFRIFRKFPQSPPGEPMPRIPQLFVEHFLPRDFAKIREWYKYSVPFLSHGGKQISETPQLTLQILIDAESKEIFPQPKLNEREAQRKQVWEYLTKGPPSQSKGKGQKQGQSAQPVGDRLLWKSVLRRDLPLDAFLLSHPYVPPEAERTPQKCLFRLQYDYKVPDGQSIKIRSVRSEADIPRIAKLVRGKGEELFGHYSYRAFVSTPPVVCFVALAKKQEKRLKKKKKEDSKLKDPAKKSHKWKIAGVIIGSVRHPPRKKEPEPPNIDAIRVRVGSTGEVISSGYLALVKVGKKFKGLKIGAELVNLFVDFCVNVYGITILLAELPEDDLDALKFYEEIGFRRYKHVPKYYPDGKASFWIEKNRLQEAKEGSPV
jgi:ribosomal protein S18 acetylase RimI-like enzyme